jgi:ATP-dependent helicase/nuclease subunit A
MPQELHHKKGKRSGIHPIVAQLTPNEEQRPAVRARGCDVVVTAGAGTGKTRTLVARYLSLLADGQPGRRGHLRNLVAITFTRKAAREMRNRVRAEVRRYLTHADLTPEQRDRWQAVYAGLDAARIGTIHSLCTEILRAHPAEAGVDPRFRVLEEGQAALLRREALDAALSWAADDPEAVRLFALLDGPGGLREALQTLLSQRLDAAAAFDAVPEEPLAHWREILRERQRGWLHALTSDPAWTDAVATLGQSEPTDPDDLMAIQRRRALDTIDGALSHQRVDPAPGEHPGSDERAVDTLHERLDALSSLDEISLVGGSYKTWPGGKAEKAAVKEALRTLRRLWRHHADLLSLQLTPLDEQLAEAIPALRAAFRFACQRYRSEKGDERALDFDDLESGALTLLRDHPRVTARWQRQTEAILVDEFQDTNSRQRDLVHLLAGDPAQTATPPSPSPPLGGIRGGAPPGGTGGGATPGKLFIVGDAKQSIYGFRGADVTVFRTERERIAGQDSSGQGWRLATSYRAHRGLIRALNDLLRPVLGEEADPRRPWAEPFAPIQPHRQDPGPGIEPPYVELHLTVGSKSDGALDRAARALVGRLAEMVEGGAQVMDSGEPRPLGYGDVAILCRASSSFSHYEDALDEAGLPYLTVAGRGFYDRPEIRDLLNALRALADPTDDLALVGLLRSPAVALSDAAIYRLVQARDEASGPGDRVDAVTRVDAGDRVDPLWAVLRRGEVELGVIGDKRAARAVRLISTLHTMAGRTGVGDLLKTFLDETHYRAALLKAGQRRAVRNVDKLLGDAHASGLVGVSSFLEYVSGLQDSGAREGEARAAAGGAVQIMSVHQAKGLEFPVVVLGDATWGGGGGGRGVLADPTLGVLPPLRDEEDDELAAVYCLAEARQADQAKAEADRLLYVAATRAREKLLVSGYLSGIRKDGTPYKLGGWLGKLGRPLGLHDLEIPYDDQGSLVHHRELHVGETSASCFIYEPACPHPRPAVPSAADEAEVPGTSLPSRGEDEERELPPPLLAPVAQEDVSAAQERTPQRVLSRLSCPRVVPETKRAKAPSRVVGDLVHEALAAWRLPESRDDEAFDPWLQARARARGLVNPQQVTHAVQRSRRLLLRFQEDPLFEELAGAERRLHEVPFSVQRQGRVDTGQIDLLYRRRSAWTIVEFKTDEVRRSADFERLLQEKDYVAQILRYTKAAEQLLGARPTCLLCMLDYGRRTRVYSVTKAGSLRAYR